MIKEPGALPAASRSRAGVIPATNRTVKPQKKSHCYEYPRPALTVDVVVLSGTTRARVLLIRRKQAPFAGAWALPGGFAEAGETLEAAARRELQEETGVTVRELEQLRAFGDPGRDPRGWTVSVAFLARVDAKQVRPRAGDDAADAAWHSLAQLPAMAFDHESILAYVKKRLRQTKVRNPNSKSEIRNPKRKP